MVFRGIRRMLKGHRKEPVLRFPRILDDCIPHYYCMKKVSFTRFSPSQTGFKDKKVRFVLFIGGGATCLQEIISVCVFHMAKDLFPLPQGTKSKSCTSTWQVFLCLGPGSCMLLVWGPILKLLDHSMQHFRRSDNSFIGVAL